MNDVFIEQFVKRGNKSAKGIYIFSLVMTILLAIGWVFVEIVAYSYMGYLLLPFLLFIFLTWRTYVNCYTEFDYNYTNGLLEIDKIVGKSRRKPVIAVELKEIVVVAPSRTDPVQPWVGKRMKTYDCTSHDDVPYYCMIVRIDGSEKKILFEPSEEMLDEMHRKLPSHIYK